MEHRMTRAAKHTRTFDPRSMIVPRRKIRGYSAILLPMRVKGGVDWSGFDDHVARTLDAGITPAVNMDTGYANLIDDATRNEVLRRTRALCGAGNFTAGAFVADTPGSRFNLDAYRAQIDAIHGHDGIPVIFQSYGLTALRPPRIADAYEQIARHCPRFIAFELGTAFAPFGKIYTMQTFTRIMQIRECIGAKHSSLLRSLEWERLAERDRVRPDFMVMTGNDLAIDMVIYGSDYLLGLSTFAPDLFGARDRMWANADPAFHELNDLLQYLGFFAFRAPVPAYKHSAAMTLKLQGWIKCDRTWRRCPQRPASDRLVLGEIVERLDAWRERCGV